MILGFGGNLSRRGGSDTTGRGGTPLQTINDIGGGSRLFALLVWITFRDHKELFDFQGEAGGIRLERLIYSRQETLN